MNKTLIASAIALATFTTGAFAATGAPVTDEDVTPVSDVASTLAARMDSMPVVYGNIQLAWAYTDADKNIGANFDDFGNLTADYFEGSTTSGIADNGSTIGFKHDHEISPGLEAFLKIELDGFGAANKANSAGRIRLDEAYIGLRGGFGEVWVGSDDSTYERLIDGISQYYEYAAFNTGLAYSTGEGQLIQYTSPSMGGFTVSAALEVDGGFEDEDGNDVGSEYPYQLGAQYAVDNLSIAVAMDSNDGTSMGNTYGVRAAFALGELELSALYSMTEDSRDDYGLMAIYSMGSNTFAASYELSAPDGDGEDTSVITLQAVHSLSDNMYIWSELYFVTSDEEGFVDFNPENDDNDLFATGNEATQLAVGAVYVF